MVVTVVGSHACIPFLSVIRACTCILSPCTIARNEPTSSFIRRFSVVSAMLCWRASASNPAETTTIEFRRLEREPSIEELKSMGAIDVDGGACRAQYVAPGWPSGNRRGAVAYGLLEPAGEYGNMDMDLPRASTCCTAGLAFANAGPLNSLLRFDPEGEEGKYCAKNAKSENELEEDGEGLPSSSSGRVTGDSAVNERIGARGWVLEAR